METLQNQQKGLVAAKVGRFLGMVMYDNEFEPKENKIQTKDKIEPQFQYGEVGGGGGSGVRLMLLSQKRKF